MSSLLLVFVKNKMLPLKEFILIFVIILCLIIHLNLMFLFIFKKLKSTNFVLKMEKNQSVFSTMHCSLRKSN